METVLEKIVETIAKIHTYLLSLNDAYEYNFTDKQLHFIVIGLIGLFLVLVIHPIFKWLAKTKHVMVITWIYVTTIIVTLTFAIEIGQNISGTGVMEFDDIVFGVVGFLFVFCIAMVIRGFWHLICKLVIYLRRKSHDRDSEYYVEDDTDDDESKADNDEE